MPIRDKLGASKSGHTVKNMQAETVTISPQEASAWISRLYDRQRKLREDAVMAIAREIRKGRFSPSTLFVLARVRESAWVVVDGQHRLNAIAIGDESVPAVVAYVTFKTQEEMADHYGVTDVGKLRNASDHMKALGLTTKLDLGTRDLAAMHSAATMVETGFVNRRTTGYGRLSHIVTTDWMMKWNPFLAEGLQLCKGSELGRRISRAAVLAVMAITLRHCNGKAHEFWEAVATDRGLEPGDARRALNRFLLTSSNDARRGGRATASTRGYAHVAAQAWKTWLRGGSVKYLRSPHDESKSINLFRTPYKSEEQTAWYWEFMNEETLGTGPEEKKEEE